MKIKMKATTPDDIEFTLSATMSLKGWKEIRKELADSHRSPVWEFREQISDAIRQTEKVYEAGDDD